MRRRNVTGEKGKILEGAGSSRARAEEEAGGKFSLNRLLKRRVWPGGWIVEGIESPRVMA